MKKRILILGLMYLLILGSVLSAEERDPINDYWQKLFPPPVEKVCIIMKDYMIFPHTSHYEDVIYMEIGRLEKALKKKGYKMGDIAVVIHNHLDDSRFSNLDYKQYRRLKRYGFNGLFLLYSNLTDKTYNLNAK